MEFVDNKIQLSRILATLIVAFFIGRINLFNGNFPAAIALIIVMVSISTVYIYLVPVVIGAMATWGFGEMYAMGDAFAVIFCGVFFLFFHKSRMHISQRFAVGVTVTVIANCLYYINIHATLMFSFAVLGKKLLAMGIFYYCFLLIGKVVFDRSKTVDVDRYMTAIAVIVVSIIGTIPWDYMVVTLWIISAFILAYFGGVNKGIEFIMLCAIFAYAQGKYEDLPLLIALVSGLMGGKMIGSIVDKRMERPIVALITFGCVYLSLSEYMYAALVGLAIYAVIPRGILLKANIWLRKVFWYEDDNSAMAEREQIINQLKGHLKTFDSLGKLYSNSVNERQIIAYQFQGMARVVRRLIKELKEGGTEETTHKRLVPIPTGSASYSFEGVSGDSQRAFYYGDKLAMVISDGMGKGARANTESTLVVNTLAQLLDAGFDVDLAMKTVNGILLTKQNSDIFATVDLALINRITGRTKIFKMGAATTFVKHNGKVAVIKQPALPAGVEPGLKLEYREVKLRRGDLLIMVSDGICDCDRKDPTCQWLIQRLEEMGSKDPNTVAELIVNKAAEKYQLRERDDLTVLVAGI